MLDKLVSIHFYYYLKGKQIFQIERWHLSCIEHKAFGQGLGFAFLIDVRKNKGREASGVNDEGGAKPSKLLGRGK